MMMYVVAIFLLQSGACFSACTLHTSLGCKHCEWSAF